MNLLYHVELDMGHIICRIFQVDKPLLLLTILIFVVDFRHFAFSIFSNESALPVAYFTLDLAFAISF